MKITRLDRDGYRDVTPQDFGAEAPELQKAKRIAVDPQWTVDGGAYESDHSADMLGIVMFALFLVIAFIGGVLVTKVGWL